MNQKNSGEKKNIFIQPYNNAKQSFLIIALFFIFLIIILFKPIFGVSYGQNIYDYHLVNSILNRKFYIDIEPSDELKKMENPYSYEDRKQEDVDYLFDTAYYNGHYYVYFGIVPALVLFIPFKLLTGTYLSVVYGTFFFVIASIVVNIALSIKIYKKWFKETPFVVLLIFILTNLLSGLYIWNTWRIWNYELTLMSGFFFVQLGIYLIIRAIEKNEESQNKKSAFFTFFSCLSMALAVGCRPTLVLSSIIMIPFLFQLIKREKKWKPNKTNSFNNNTISNSSYSINVV